MKEIYTADSKLKFKKIFSNLKKNGKIKDQELTILTKKGKKRTVLLSANSILNKKKEIVTLVYVQKDITEHKKIDDKLNLLMTAVKEAPDGVLIMNVDGLITYVNKAMEKIYGFSRKEKIGKNIKDANIYSVSMQNKIISIIKKKRSLVGRVGIEKKQ